MSIQWVAHRGECQSKIENTLSSINDAIKSGITNIEIDVQLSKDGIPVLFHDRNLSRMAKRNDTITALDSSVIQQLILAPDNNAHLDQKTDKIPTLSDVVTLIGQHPKITLFVEVKKINFLTFSYQNVYKKIVDTLNPILSQTVIISFSYRFLMLCRHQCQQNIGYVLPSWQQFNKKMLTKLQPKYIFCDELIIPKTFQFKNTTIHWVLYEISDISQAKYYVNRGVQYLESFHTGKLQQQLSSDLF
ncbi:MAG: glycerophosphoryl diester phosphodiesterase [Alteromonadaceae bacterium]|jgi:glycerophosphoryl diester phosphodiesterase